MLRWDSLYQAGHTDQVAAEIHAFATSRLPAHHPLRVALERIGFKTGADRNELAQHEQTGRMLAALLGFVGHALQGDTGQLEERLMYAAALLVREGRLDLLEELTANSREAS